MEQVKILKKLMEAVDSILENSGKMNKFMQSYIINMDAWVKKINDRVAKVEETPLMISENVDNIEFNFEKIIELQERIEFLELLLKRTLIHKSINNYKYQKDNN